MNEQTASNAHYIDPQMKPILERMREKMASRAGVQVSPPEMRVRFLADMAVWNQNPVELPRVEDKTVPGAFGDVRVRLYDPVGGGTALPAIIYFHGGGWIVGNSDSVDAGLRLLAKLSGVAVLSVDYALAPEHKFPEPLEDCIAVSRWLRGHAGAWGVDTERLAIGGDSAGANLALATLLALRDSGENWLKFALLLYGAYAADYVTQSHRDFGGVEYGVGTEGAKKFWSMYLRDEADRLNPLAAPLFAELGGLPPLYLVAAGLDPLRDDTRNLARRLAQARVPHEVKEYSGVVHGFMSMVHRLDAAVEATKAAAEALRTAVYK